MSIETARTCIYGLFFISTKVSRDSLWCRREWIPGDTWRAASVGILRWRWHSRSTRKTSKSKVVHARDKRRNDEGRWRTERSLECLVAEVEKKDTHIANRKAPRKYCGRFQHEGWSLQLTKEASFQINEFNFCCQVLWSRMYSLTKRNPRRFTQIRANHRVRILIVICLMWTLFSFSIYQSPIS